MEKVKANRVSELDKVESELVNHAVNSIRASDVFSLPFPHIFFREFFPQDFYEELISKTPQNNRNALNADRTRMSVRLYGDYIDQLETEILPIWRRATNVLTSESVANAIRQQLHEGLVIRALGEKRSGPEDLNLIAKPILSIDYDGYKIKPHPDTRRKVVTMMLYLPEDNSQELLGTTLYKQSLKGIFNFKDYCLEPVKTLPFLPNVGYAFVVLKAYHTLSKISWHGRPEVVLPNEKPRVSIINTFYGNENDVSGA